MTQFLNVFTIIPAYNESSTIESVIRDVKQYCPQIVVVDDGSSDATADLASAAGVFVLRHIVNRGQGAALQTGIDYALAQGAEVIVTFDADGQHRAEDIDLLVKPILNGQAEVVLGSRFLISNFQFLISNKMSNVKCQMSNVPLLRKLTLKLALLHQWFFTGLKVTDTHCGLRAFSRRAASKIKITQDRMAHASEILDQIAGHKLSFVEAPVQVKYTEYSRRKGQGGVWGSVRVICDYLVGRVV